MEGTFAPVVVGGSAGHGTLAPLWLSPKASSRCCVHVRVSSEAPYEVIHEVWQKSGNNTLESLHREGRNGGRLLLPSDWEGARIATVQISEEDETFTDRTWAVVLRSGRSGKESKQNVWVGRFEGHGSFDLEPWGCFHCPIVSHAVRAGPDSLSQVRVSILDGPLFAIGWDSEIAICSRVHANGSVHCDEPGWSIRRIRAPDNVQSLGTILCSANIDGTGRNEGILCAGTARDLNRHAYMALLSVNGSMGNVQVVGPLDTCNIPSSAILSDAIFDLSSKSCVVVWSNGLVCWIDVRSATCFQAEVLPSRAGIPVRICFGSDRNVVFVTCIVKGSSPKKELLEVWAIRGNQTGKQREAKMGLCFQEEQWNGFLDAQSDFMALAISEIRDSEHMHNQILAVRHMRQNESETGTVSIHIGHLPWRDAGDSASGLQFTKMHERLELRLKAGLRSLVETNLVAMEKEALASHMRRLLNQITSTGPSPKTGDIFHRPLQNLIVGPIHPLKKDADSSAIDRSRLEGPDHGTTLPGHARGDDRLVEVIRADHFLDESGDYLMIALRVRFQSAFRTVEHSSPDDPPLEDHGHCNHVWIEVQIGQVIEATWDSSSTMILERDRVGTLLSRVQVEDLVAACVVGLSDLRADVRALSSDGRTHVLGSFTIAPNVLLSRSRGSPGPPAWCREACMHFSHQAVLLARGDSESSTRTWNRRKGTAGGSLHMNVHPCESGAVVRVYAPSGAMLAAAAAEITASVPDDVKLCMAPVAEPHISTLNNANHAFKDELETMRKFARQRESSTASFAALFEQQIETDEAVGVMEESFVGII